MSQNDYSRLNVKFAKRHFAPFYVTGKKLLLIKPLAHLGNNRKRYEGLKHHRNVFPEDTRLCMKEHCYLQKNGTIRESV